jgi:hypothetical protein
MIKIFSGFHGNTTSSLSDNNKNLIYQQVFEEYSDTKRPENMSMGF